MPEENKVLRKTFATELKLDGAGEGTFEAVIATMNVIDSDMDLTEPGAFGVQNVILSQYNHGSWGYGEKALPIGVGVISESGNDAIIKGEFDMSDPVAVKTYEKIKYLKAKGRVQEWSYSLPEIESEWRDVEGGRIRILKKIKVNEVSPVLMGAGVNTRLLDIKTGKQDGLKLVDHIKSVLADVEEVTERLQTVKDMRERNGKEIAPDTAESMSGLEYALKEAVEKLEQLKQHDSGLEEEMLIEHMRYQKILADRRAKCL